MIGNIVIYMFIGLLLGVLSIIPMIIFSDDNQEISDFVNDENVDPLVRLSLDPTLELLNSTSESEIINLILLFGFYGYTTAKAELLEKYIFTIRNSSYIEKRKTFHANNFSHPQILTAVANDFLKSVNGKHEAINRTGLPFAKLLKLINEKVPCIVWMDTRMFDYLSAKSPELDEYCGIVMGYNTKKEVIYVFNPYLGEQEIDMGLFYDAYVAHGRYAVTIQ